VVSFITSKIDHSSLQNLIRKLEIGIHFYHLKHVYVVECIWDLETSIFTSQMPRQYFDQHILQMLTCFKYF